MQSSLSAKLSNSDLKIPPVLAHKRLTLKSIFFIKNQFFWSNSGQRWCLSVLLSRSTTREISAYAWLLLYFPNRLCRWSLYRAVDERWYMNLDTNFILAILFNSTKRTTRSCCVFKLRGDAVKSYLSLGLSVEAFRTFFRVSKKVSHIEDEKNLIRIQIQGLPDKDGRRLW